MTDFKQIIKMALDSRYFKGKGAPLVGKFEPGEGKLVVVTGDNATGKSFFTRLVKEIYKREDKLDTYRVGMDFRASSGIGRCLVMGGDEHEDSTGVLSINIVQGGLNTCRNHEVDHLMIFDEPDIGLSEGYQGAVGKMIAKVAVTLPEKTKMLMVVTHSRRIVRHLIPLKPSHVRIGDKKTIEEFMVEPPDRSLEELEALGKQARALHSDIEAKIKVARAERNK